MELSAIKKHKTGLLTIASVAMVAAIVLSSFDRDENMVPPTQETGTESRVETGTVPTSDAKPSATTPSAPRPAGLHGTRYRLSAYNGYVVPATTNYTLAFRAGNPTFEDGFADVKFCNALTGPYDMDRNVLSVPLSGAKMYCDDAKLREMEGAFVVLMQGGAQMRQEGSTLTLTDNVRTFVFKRQ